MWPLDEVEIWRYITYLSILLCLIFSFLNYRNYTNYFVSYLKYNIRIIWNLLVNDRIDSIDTILVCHTTNFMNSNYNSIVCYGHIGMVLNWCKIGEIEIKIEVELLYHIGVHFFPGIVHKNGYIEQYTE